MLKVKIKGKIIIVHQASTKRDGYSDCPELLKKTVYAGYGYYYSIDGVRQDRGSKLYAHFRKNK